MIFWGVAAVFFALGIRKYGPTFALITAISIAALILRRWVSARAQQSGDASASALTITFDDDALRMFAASGAISHPWNTARRIVEDEKVLVIVFSGTNVIIPKRSLDDELIALIRERIAAQPSPTPRMIP